MRPFKPILALPALAGLLAAEPAKAASAPLAAMPATWATACSLCLAQPTGDRITLRNNLLPGHLTRHRITRVTTRTSQRRKHVETLEYRQEAEWLRCNIEEPRPASAMAYLMIVDRPAEVVRVLRDKKTVRPKPPAEDFNLPGGSTRLQSVNITPRDAPAQLPLANPVEKALLTALLDVAHWPPQRIEAARRWQRNLETGGFSGVQTFEFVDLLKLKTDDTAARLTLFVEGKFTGALERDYVFEKGQAIIHWSRSERTILNMEAQAFYQRRRENAPEQYKLKLDVILTSVEMLKEPEQDSVKDQMIAFAEALAKQREGLPRDALELCRRFQAKWPDSMWMPAVTELVTQLAPRKTEAPAYSTDQVKDLLAKSVAVYEAAGSNYEYDLLERTRRVLYELADAHYANLKKLARDKHEGLRALAVFALAFSERPAALDLVQAAARDLSPRVKEMALAGLAARGSPETNTLLLLDSLEDAAPRVRQQACEAVAACLSPEHYAVAALVPKLDHLMIFDDSDRVRLAAVRAIAAIGAPADVPRFEKALTHELNSEIRRQIHGAIERIKARS